MKFIKSNYYTLDFSGKPFDGVITDVPYQGSLAGQLGEEFFIPQDFMNKSFSETKPDAFLISFIHFFGISNMVMAAKQVGWNFMNFQIWNKNTTSSPNHDDPRPRKHCEYIIYFTKGNYVLPDINKVFLEYRVKYQTKVHDTEKPTEFSEWFKSLVGDAYVLDPYCGSGNLLSAFTKSVGVDIVDYVSTEARVARRVELETRKAKKTGKASSKTRAANAAVGDISKFVQIGNRPSIITGIEETDDMLKYAFIKIDPYKYRIGNGNYIFGFFMDNNTKQYAIANGEVYLLVLESALKGKIKIIKGKPAEAIELYLPESIRSKQANIRETRLWIKAQKKKRSNAAVGDVYQFIQTGINPDGGIKGVFVENESGALVPVHGEYVVTTTPGMLKTSRIRTLKGTAGEKFMKAKGLVYDEPTGELHVIIPKAHGESQVAGTYTKKETLRIRLPRMWADFWKRAYRLQYGKDALTWPAIPVMPEDWDEGYLDTSLSAEENLENLIGIAAGSEKYNNTKRC